MRFDFTDVQAAWRSRAELLASDLALDASAADAVMGAARHGLLDRRADLLSIAAAVEAVSFGSPSAGVALAFHSVAALACESCDRFADLLFRGEMRGAIALSSEDVPVERNGTLSGRVSWVGPITDGGLAVVGAWRGDQIAALAVPLANPGVTIESVQPAGLRGLSCAHLVLHDAQAIAVGLPVPLMARSRVLIAAVGLGIGRRALGEALGAAREDGAGAAGEQTVQGLLADAATELDAAMLLTWKAAAEDRRLSLGDASMAKLAATGAAQRALLRTTQVVGVETFRAGHVIERLAQDVRALELFAGRTEALRTAVAAEVLPAVAPSPTTA